ncbi:MAG: hypothetical protein IJN69_03665 [Oscillospiraceae bacterium]|nr:hypothetical protein [Oscillospiraceae bacterium]
MGKSVYSIVLDDEVIRGIDMMAAQQGTSRSNMINRLLAQHISMPTAETMLLDVYNSINEVMDQHSSLVLQLLGNGNMINMRSALQYKYNPSIKYSVELLEKGGYYGQLKISMRSRNTALIAILDSFFALWAQLEMQYCDIAEDEFSFEKGRYARLLRKDNSRNFNDYGTKIAMYIDLLDSCMKEYFNNISISSAAAANSTVKKYLAEISAELVNI